MTHKLHHKLTYFFDITTDVVSKLSLATDGVYFDQILYTPTKKGVILRTVMRIMS